jgi:hypothetical protein
MKTFGELRSDVANKMWEIWCPVKPTPIVPEEFYEMATVAIRMTNAEFDKMISDKIKERLERLLESDA